MVTINNQRIRGFEIETDRNSMILYYDKVAIRVDIDTDLIEKLNNRWFNTSLSRLRSECVLIED